MSIPEDLDPEETRVRNLILKVADCFETKSFSIMFNIIDEEELYDAADDFADEAYHELISLLPRWLAEKPYLLLGALKSLNEQDDLVEQLAIINELKRFVP